MNVLSLFDGMSCGRLALEQTKIKVNRYYASEIDKYAIKIAQKNFPDNIQLGDVLELTNGKIDQLEPIDLLIGGSPCQGFSRSGKQLNFNDPRSQLFFEYVRVLNYLRQRNPDLLFLLENVKMKPEWENVITEYLDVEPIKINSSLVSAQNRERLYWTNIPDVQQPEDKGIFLPDIFDYHDQTTWEKKFNFSDTYEDVKHYIKIDRKGNKKRNQLKASCLTGGHRGDGNHSDMDLIIYPGGKVRRYSPLECERLQTIPDRYSEGVSNTQRYKMLSNGWTVNVVAYILNHI